MKLRTRLAQRGRSPKSRPGTVNLPVGASVTFTVTATISAAATGTLSNTATITPPGGVTDPNPGNNSATDTDTLVAGIIATTTAVTSSSNPSQPGDVVTFTATVTKSSGSGTPTGTVTFKDGATVIGTVALAGGVATLATSSLATGNHAITAVYGGDATFAGSCTAVLRAR